MATTYDYPEPGCYADGCRGLHDTGGQYDIVFDLAESYGWKDRPESPDDEFIDEAADEAIDYLNSLETREGFYWAFENGDFGLWADSEDER